jgi:hypothetical protein
VLNLNNPFKIPGAPSPVKATASFGSNFNPFKPLVALSKLDEGENSQEDEDE